MNSHQLRLFLSIADSDFSVTRAARALYTSQPAVSKQMIQLEEELKAPLFLRKGKKLLGLTAFGEASLQQARSALGHMENIRAAAKEFADPKAGALSIATTHTQARYALPAAIQKFRLAYPRVALHIHQGSPRQIAAMLTQGEVDFAIATEGLDNFKNLILLPWYRWNRCIITPVHHPLLREKKLTLRSLASHPLITYTFGFTGRSRLDAAFDREGLKPEVVLTAVDSDIIKTYVKLGLGVGIIARMAFDPKEDKGLRTLNADHLFQPSVVRVAFRPDIHMAGFKYAFLQLLAPHFSKKLVGESFHLSAGELDTAFGADRLPVR